VVHLRIVAPRDEATQRSQGHVGHCVRLVPVEDDLAELLGEQQMSCRLWPEQTEGPYRRDMPPERRDITEGRDGVPVRVALRLLDAGTGNLLTGALVEVWQADHEGRYSGFRPFRTRPGQIVTSASVPRDVVAPSETFLRGCQRTDDRGFCVFDTIYPGWYPSRTVHIHLAVQVGDHQALTQLYFPDDLTDEVFARPPYAGRPPRDTTNAADSIFVDGGERTVLHLFGDAVDGLTGVLCLGVEQHPASPAPSGPTAESD
jgi:protocatechuate 3,4-dioxygenase beta subunit